MNIKIYKIANLGFAKLIFDIKTKINNIYNLYKLESIDYKFDNI